MKKCFSLCVLVLFGVFCLSSLALAGEFSRGEFPTSVMVNKPIGEKIVTEEVIQNDGATEAVKEITQDPTEKTDCEEMEFANCGEPTCCESACEFTCCEPACCEPVCSEPCTCYTPVNCCMPRHYCGFHRHCGFRHHYGLWHRCGTGCWNCGISCSTECETWNTAAILPTPDCGCSR